MAAFAIVAGCGDETVKKLAEPTSAPKPVTPQEVKQAFSSLLQPFYEYAQKVTSETQVPADYANGLKARLADLTKKYKNEEAGKREIRDAINRFEELLKVSRDASNIPMTLLLCDLVEQLDPASKHVDRFRLWATTLQKRPIVVVRGWYQPLDTPETIIYVFLKVYIPETQQVKSVRVREGEEFDGLKFLKILGKKSGIRLQYVATGDVFDVYGP